MNKLKFINFSTVLLILFFGIIGASAQTGNAPDIRGRMTKLNRTDAQTNDLLGSILVARDTEEAGGEYVENTREYGNCQRITLWKLLT